MQPYYESDGVTLYHGDCLEVMAGLPDNSINLIAEDPPYYKVKNEHWDNAWDTADGFIDWLGQVMEAQHRLLVFNGSQYTFASAKMAARVELKIAERFNVLNHIVWRKAGNLDANNGQWSLASKESLRSYFSQTERIIFSEHYNSDNIAKGEAGYGRKCDELRGFVFEPLRAYLASEWKRAGLKYEQANEACGTASMAGRHFFSTSQWCLPTQEKYSQMQRYANRTGGDYLKREYDYLKREYDDLKREYDDLRRPFSVTADVPYTDIWDFTTVAYYPDKHPCEKPLDLMEHIIRTSSRPAE